MNCIRFLFPKAKKMTDTQVVGKLILRKLYKNMHQQIGENVLSGFCFFVVSFLNTLPIPRQDQGKLPESYNQNT